MCRLTRTLHTLACFVPLAWLGIPASATWRARFLTDCVAVCAWLLLCAGEIIDVIQPEKQTLTQPYVNTGLDFERPHDANKAVRVPPYALATAAPKL